MGCEPTDCYEFILCDKGLVMLKRLRHREKQAGLNKSAGAEKRENSQLNGARLQVFSSLRPESLDGLQVVLELDNIFPGNDTYDFLSLSHTDPFYLVAKHFLVGFLGGQVLINGQDRGTGYR